MLLRWSLEQGAVVIPTASSPEHLAENLDLFGWRLGPEDRRALEALDGGEKVYGPEPEGIP